MRNIRSWLQKLREAIREPSEENPPDIARIQKRVIYPAMSPLEGAGFLRFQGLQSYLRPGHGHERLSVMSWFTERSDDPDHLGTSIDARSVGAILSVALDRAFEVPAEIPLRTEGSELTHMLPLDVGFDRVLHAPVPNVDEINEKFKEQAQRLLSLNDQDSDILGAAIEMHHAACVLYKYDIASAYVLVVGGLEVLSSKYQERIVGWERWDRAEVWTKWAREVGLSPEQEASLRTRLLSDNQIRLGERYANYVEQLFADRSWLENWQEWTWTYDGSTWQATGGQWTTNDVIASTVPVDPVALRRAIKLSYNARSGYVHKGKRDINLPAEAARQVARAGDRQPITFTVLRAALSRAIKAELKERSASADFPEIVGFMDYDDPEQKAREMGLQ